MIIGGRSTVLWTAQHALGGSLVAAALLVLTFLGGWLRCPRFATGGGATADS
jgi:hypothetical protein